jgi:putative ABC transport system permease protein
MTWKLALRNVFRNRRRTGFTLAVMIVGASILLFLLGFIGEALRSTQQSFADETGAVQIADARLFENTAENYDYLISPGVLERVVEIVRAEPGVVSLTWRLDFAGLIGDASGSTLLVGQGVVPCNAVQDYNCAIVDGTTLSGPGERSDREAVLGRALARKLGVTTGDRISIATGTVSGAFNAATVDVVGEMSYAIEEVEKQLAIFPISFVQRLLKTDGVERVLVRLENLDDSDAVAASLQAKLADAGIPLAVLTWEELNPSFESLRTFYTGFSGLAGIAVFVLVFFSVLEVLTIAFLERTREIGTLRALGALPSRVFRTFFAEGIWLGLIGGVAGIVVGVGVALVFNAIGFTWTPPGAAMPQAIRLQLDVSTVLIPLFAVIAATLVSAIYPSRKNARARIVDALRSA